MIFIPRFAAVALGVLLRPRHQRTRPPTIPADSQPALAGFDTIDAVLVGTVLDVWPSAIAGWHASSSAPGKGHADRRDHRRRRPMGTGSTDIGAGERWMIVADRLVESA